MEKSQNPARVETPDHAQTRSLGVVVTGGPGGVPGTASNTGADPVTLAAKFRPNGKPQLERKEDLIYSP